MNLFTIKECLKLPYEVPALEFQKIKLDSREIEKGDIFFVYGLGENYVEEAVSSGAVAIITEKDIQREDTIVLKVPNSLEALFQLGELYRQNYHGKVIAITGSNGKTTTKELLKHFLSQKYSCLSTLGSENNHIGVPKTLLQMEDSYEMTLLEMGMNHLGEIYRLSKISHPDIGIITNIGTNHIGYLGSQEKIFEAKKELMEATPSIELFVSGLDPYLKTLPAHLVYPISTSLEVPAIDYALASEVASYLGISKDEIEASFTTLPKIPSRLEKIEIHDKILLDDAFNASFESFLLGLERLEKYPGRKILLLGDFLELGEYQKEIYQKMKERVSRSNYLVFTLGENFQDWDSISFSTIEEMKQYFSTFSFQKGDVIYLKASHRVGLSSLVSYFQNIL